MLKQQQEAWLIRPVTYQLWRSRGRTVSEKNVPRSAFRVPRINVACAECEQTMTERGTRNVEQGTPPEHPSAPAIEAPSTDDFPSFDHAVSPVSRIPNWGAMTSPEQWEQPYRAMDPATFVALPRYDLQTLTMPMLTLLKHREENTAAITAKLYYSTRHFAAYNLDAEEFSGIHPGIDLKLALGTPVGAIGGGRVHRVMRDENLGLHIIIEHHVPDVGIFFSIYGHLGESWVSEGDTVTPGKTIGTVGMSGRTTAPHLHLQIDTDNGVRPHVRYWPNGMPSPTEAEQFTMHPMGFIGKY